MKRYYPKNRHTPARMTEILAERRRDWFRILRDLMGAGVSMAEVGRSCNRTRFTVHNWAEGGEPKESDARVILTLYAKHCPDKYRVHAAQFEIPLAIRPWDIDQWLAVSAALTNALKAQQESMK